VSRLRAGGLHPHPLRGVFCKNCNTQVELQESRETRGYEEAVLACFDTDTTWNLHVDEAPARPPGRIGARESTGELRANTRSTGGVQNQVRTGSRSSAASSAISTSLQTFPTSRRRARLSLSALLWSRFYVLCGRIATLCIQRPVAGRLTMGSRTSSTTTICPGYRIRMVKPL